MSASLVGSEMCIRDRCQPFPRLPGDGSRSRRAAGGGSAASAQLHPTAMNSAGADSRGRSRGPG
eukprot:5277845-Alexandrium_andersonii.AAC.1